ncbi:hypothetical protein [Nocardioides convexus]|uniref:hypothetical protein n=1 Tax=Nocardioides convexus TaxID=2712224 RepID=UPI0024188F49|nr:hypothetical protein [Nocardioides convexus]
MAEALMDELRLALAQVDRLSRNAHDEAESHEGLVEPARGRAHRRTGRRVRLPAPPHRRGRGRGHRGPRPGMSLRRAWNDGAMIAFLTRWGITAAALALAAQPARRDLVRGRHRGQRRGSPTRSSRCWSSRSSRARSRPG